MFIVKNKNINFVRFGGLSALKQDHYITDEEKKNFHNPPVKRGFYAFPEKYIEYFLLGSTSDPDHISGKSEYIKDDNGERIIIKESDYSFNSDGDYVFNKDIQKILKKKKIKLKNVRTRWISEEEGSYLFTLKKPRVFEYRGEIWSHFTHVVKPENVIEIKGCWVKTTYEDYVDAFYKNLHELMKHTHKDPNFGIDLKNIKSNNPYRNRFFITYCKDDLEVFIEGI